MSDIAIRPLTDTDSEWVKEFIMQHWGSPIMIVHGVTYTLHELPGFVADVEGERVGLLTYDIQGRAYEIVSLDSMRPSVGTALMEAIKAYACQKGLPGLLPLVPLAKGGAKREVIEQPEKLEDLLIRVASASTTDEAREAFIITTEQEDTEEPGQ